MLRNRLISRILYSDFAGGNHSSRPYVTERLERPTRKRCPDFAGPSGGQPDPRFPIWSCTTRSLPGRAMLPRTPVSPYLTVSPITSFEAGLLSVALVVIRFYSNARTLSGSLPYGVRTFLFFSKAIAWPVPLLWLCQYSKEC